MRSQGSHECPKLPPTASFVWLTPSESPITLHFDHLSRRENRYQSFRLIRGLIRTTNNSLLITCDTNKPAFILKEDSLPQILFIYKLWPHLDREIYFEVFFKVLFLNAYFTLHTRINFKWVKDLNVNVKNIKVLEEDGQIPWCREDFSNYDSKFRRKENIQRSFYHTI